MRKNIKELIKYWFLWCTIFFLCLSLISPSCNAGTASTSLGSRYKAIPWIPDWLWQEELEHDATVAKFIFTLAALRHWNKKYNWYGALTTADNIYTAAYGHGEAYAIAWYIGHSSSEYLWNWAGWIWYYEQQWFILDDSGGHVYDKDIYQHTTSKNTKFVMLWSCYQADTIGGTHWSGTPFGMPYAWLHTTDLSNDGYASPDGKGYVFIGWKGGCPALIAEFEGVDEAGYKFLLNFYAYAFYGHNINNALDYASEQVWGIPFNQDIFYNGYVVDDEFCQMKVYGDGSHTLPFNG